MNDLARWVWWDAFRNGPTWIGGWGGAGDADVCARMTAFDARHWHAHPAACASMIERQFDAFISMQRPVLAIAALYMLAVLVVGLVSSACSLCAKRILLPSRAELPNHYLPTKGLIPCRCGDPVPPVAAA